MVLTERQRAVLGAVIRGYVARATPVGSKALLAQPGLGVSSATIRHEMALLEREGYLTHPHTSAGRVPTEKGYRYFVEHLMGETELSLEEQRTISHQFHQARLDLEQWVRLSATVLAHSARNAALVTSPKARRSRLKHLELISTGPKAALLVLVLQGGTIRQEIVTALPAFSQEELNRLANELNATLGNLSAEEIRGALPWLGEFPGRVAQCLVGQMEQTNGKESGEVYHEGLAHILRQPEFSHVERVERILELLRRRWFMESLLEEMGTSRGGVQILIGGEGRWVEMEDFSLILSRYGVAQEATGILGILGPTRMPYERCVSVVRYVAGLMTDLLSTLVA
jgi:heat-inducible transcriptional repressor